MTFTVRFTANLTNNADGTVINHGTIDGSLDNSGTITNQADAAISNKVTNNGTISTYGTISGTLTNNGTIMVGPDGSIPSNSGGSVIPFPDGETYLDASGTPQNIPANAKFLLPGATTLDGWYVVCGKVTLTNRPTVTGEAHLILVDGCELNANSGINVGEGANLTIYAQSNGSNMGKLTALGNFNQAGIGGDAGESGGTITINGGTIAARNDNNGAAGIGGGNEGAGGAITINAARLLPVVVAVPRVSVVVSLARAAPSPLTAARSLPLVNLARVSVAVALVQAEPSPSTEERSLPHIQY